jgi:signal transduction histidine kinase
MIGRLDRRFLCVAFAVMCLVAAAVVWVVGENRLGTLRRAMWQQTGESLAGETVELLQSQAVLAGFVGAVIPLTGLGGRFEAILGEMVQRHPELRAIVVSDETGRVVMEAWRNQASTLRRAGDDLQVVQPFAPSPSAGQPLDEAQGREQDAAPVLVRTSEASSLPAMVGVGVSFRLPEWRLPGRVTVLTLGADMPSARAVRDRIWLIGHDDAAIAEPGLLTKMAKASSGLDWTVLRRMESTAGMMRLAMEDGAHDVFYRKLDPWPATLVIDTGQAARRPIQPHGVAALALGVLAAFWLWRAKRMPTGQAGAGARSCDPIMAPADRNAVTRRLAAEVAHTFNNVLTVLAFDAEMVGVVAPDDVRLQVLSRSMIGAAALGTQLTQRLLCYAERAVLRPRMVDLEIELSKRHHNLSAALDPGQTLLFEFPANPGCPVLVSVDPDALEICLMALLRNAADATPPRAEIRLTMNLVQSGCAEMVALVVDDAGPGMDAFTLAHAMEPGFSSSPDGRPDSRRLGLGLSAAVGFARQSGGQLTLDSAPGLGTQVRLLLPLLKDGSPSDAIVGLVSNAMPVAPTSSLLSLGLPAPTHRIPPCPKRVLLVEDNATVRDSITRRLRANGYDVTEAVTVAEVLDQVARGVDLMLTDIVLNDATDGWALAAQARQINPTLPLVFMSGFMSSRQPELLAGDELASFVRKPVDSAELHTVIVGLLALHETRQIQKMPDAIET